MEASESAELIEDKEKRWSLGERLCTRKKTLDGKGLLHHLPELVLDFVMKRIEFFLYRLHPLGRGLKLHL